MLLSKCPKCHLDTLDKVVDYDRYLRIKCFNPKCDWTNDEALTKYKEENDVLHK